MSTQIKACSPAPQDSSDALRFVASNYLWDVGHTLGYKFTADVTNNQQQAIKDAMAIWQTYANIDFGADAKTPDVLISCSGPGSWSYVGTNCASYANKGKVSMNLGWLADAYPASAEDRATILHELGHTLGVMHEHQSPARNEYLHLKVLPVYRYYRPLLGYNDRLVKSQVIDVYNSEQIMNMSHLDLHSIMMYFMPAELNEEGIEVPINLDLSKIDKAFITLNYPNVTVKTGGMTVLEALGIVGVPNDVAAVITGYIAHKDDQGNAAPQYAEARKAFSVWNMAVMDMSASNRKLLSGVDPNNAVTYGLSTSLLDFVAQNPLFVSVIKNLVNQVVVQRGIPAVTGIPGSAQKDVLDSIGAIVTQSALKDVVHGLTNDIVGALPPTSGTSTPTTST
ncbi:hypothetical protein B0H14DRAFT_3892182 [Mycena olivaceomarginata]|nr:hypothetical protein B0H14DRAFT_3892182 [Mycena olivaceomarginata]